ncbi:MAG: helix-turn-helix domain-containing protein [Pseudomonadota bacterium]
MAPLPRKKTAPENTKLYESLGSLIKDYRQWRKLSQEALAELIGISVRELQNWEADRHGARIGNLHDLSEVTGIPMQICVALTAAQPLWYSLRNRRFAYSSIDEALFSSRELLRNPKLSDDGVITKYTAITTDKHISMILSCHGDIYGTKIFLGVDVIKAAIFILPDFNRIAFDSWGHYVGHQVCLPITMDTYEQIKKKKTFEGNLTIKEISNIVAQQEGVFYFYSIFMANTSVAQSILINNHRGLAKIKHKKKYLVARVAATIEGKEISDSFGMKLVFCEKSEQKDMQTEIVPALYEIGLDALERRALRLFPLVGEHQQERKADATKREGLLALSALKPKNVHGLRKKIIAANRTACFPLSVDDSLSVDKKETQEELKTQTYKYGFKKEACPNPNCALNGKIKKDNIVSNGTYRTKEGTLSHRFLCKECGESFCSRAGSLFYGLRSPEEEVLMSLKLLAKGMPSLSVSKALGVRHDTVQRWLAVAAEQNGKIDAMLKEKLNVSQHELDALWFFVKSNSLRPGTRLRKGRAGC